MPLPKLDSSAFDWHTWRNGSIVDFGLAPAHRTPILLQFRDSVRRYAVGYCEGESLSCRPKLGHKAVMFLVNETFFWTHLTDFEFAAIFGEVV